MRKESKRKTVATDIVLDVALTAQHTEQPCGEAHGTGADEEAHGTEAEDEVEEYDVLEKMTY